MKKKIGLFLSVFAFFVGAIWVIPVTTNSGWTLNDESSVKAKVDQVASCNSYASESWSKEKQTGTLTALNQQKFQSSGVPASISLWFILFYLPNKQLTFDDDGQSKTLCFDQLLPALRQQATAQNKFPVGNAGFDFTKITGTARHQLFQLFVGVKEKGVWFYHSQFTAELLLPLLEPTKKNFYSLRLKTAIAKMMWLFSGYLVAVGTPPFSKSLYFVLTSKNVPDGKGVEALWQGWWYWRVNRTRILYLSFLNPTQAHTHFEKVINKIWTPKLQILQQARDLVLILVEDESGDVASLVNSQVKEASELSLSEVKTLKALEKHINNLQLDKFKAEVQPSLQKLVSAKVNQLTIDDKTYPLNHLLIKDNLAKSGSQLQGDAKTQLLDLAKAKITNSQLDTALNQVLTVRRAQVEKEKVEKETKTKPKKPVVKKPTEQKPVREKPEATKKIKAKKTEETKKKIKTKDKKSTLTIGLATGGGVLLLAGGAGGFLYWFYKIKK